MLFSMQALFVVNVLLLVIGPIITVVLLAFVIVATKKSDGGSCAPHTFRVVVDIILVGHVTEDGPKWNRIKTSSRVIVGWGRFWIALIVGILAHVGLVAGYININPHVSFSLQTC